MTKINPDKITDYRRSETQLQQFWLFCLFIAGKNSDWAAEKVAQLLVDCECLPFGYLYSIGDNLLQAQLHWIRSGQYGRLSRAITESLDLNLATCTLDQLLAIHGVGPKTARMFLVHSRKDVQHAVLDTHVLRWMGEHGVTVPKTTPSTKKYAVLEKQCIDLLQKHYPHMTIAEADLHIWKTQRYHTTST